MPTTESHENQCSPLPNGTESGSRKSSTTTQHTSQTRDSAVEAHVNSTVSLSDIPFEPLGKDELVEFDKLVEDGLRFTDDTGGARQWLLDFGYLKDGTDVSLRFRHTVVNSKPDVVCSLIPLFSEWVPTWYRATKDRRKTDKTSRETSYKEQDDFDWLLRFIADYICLGHETFDEGELARLCVELTRVCQETGRQKIIHDSIVIFHCVMVETVFPHDALSPALEVFCAGTVTLPDLPAELFESVKLLLTGPLHQEAVDWLMDCVMTPSVQNDSHRLIEARGAIRQVRHHLEVVHKTGSFAIDLPSFLDCLNQASKCCIFRFCTEVIFACQNILESARLEQLLQTDLRAFVGTVDNCTRTVLPRNDSNRSLEALRSADRSQVAEKQRQNDKYLAERRAALRQLMSAFEGVWGHLSNTQARIIGDFFMENAKDLSDAQAAIVMSHLSRQSLLMPDKDDWWQRCTAVLDSFVRNIRLSVSERIFSAQLCVDAAIGASVHAIENHPSTKESTLATGKNIINTLLNVIGKEVNTAVIRGILTPLQNLTDLVDTQGRPLYASLVIGRLLYFVKSEREGEDEVSDQHVLMFTQAIRDIFLRGLYQKAGVAVEAYQALLEVASVRCRSRRCRLAALRLLLRIRSDDNGMIYVDTSFDSQYIAAALCRTEETRDAYTKELATQLRGSGSHLTSLAHGTNARSLWMYPNEASCMHNWDTRSSDLVAAPGTKTAVEGSLDLNMTSWLVTLIESLQSDTDWETYSFILVHLGAQLFNIKLFSSSLQAIVLLRQVLCEQIHNNTFKEPPAATGLKKSDAALCIFNMLTALIPYASMRSEKIQKGFGDDLVRAFVAGIGNTWDGTHRGCIHALSVCSFEIPASVATSYPSIIQTMSKNMSQSHLTIHILEFLAQVARLPEVHSSFNQVEITQIFGICLQFLEKTRETQSSSVNAPSPRSGTPARHSSSGLRRPPYRQAIVQDTALPQYAAALAHHTMIFWFLSLRLEERAKYVSWITPRLVWKNSKGEEVIGEQSQVFIDMMQRTAFSDLGETAANPLFAKDSDGTISSESWIVGLSVVTVETAGHTGLTQIIKRQASGTTHTLCQQLTASTPSHHAPLHTQLRPEEIGRFGTTDMLPAHVILQMISTAVPTPVEDQPIFLPQEDYTARALNVFDRIPTVDSHKIGVLYIGPGQAQESEYLANRETSPGFEKFLSGLGYRVGLTPPLRYNPQGLQHPRDGETTMAWRDRISEIVFHVPSMMPNYPEEDPSCNIKKSHVGNCHVVIIYNESGMAWKLDNFSSAVTFVHVIVTPVNRAGGGIRPTAAHSGADDPTLDALSLTTTDGGLTDFYQVLVVTKAAYPNVSPAADPKVVSSHMLPTFVRMFSINANLFSQAKVAADSDDDEWPSSWRGRLQAIKRLRERVIEKSNGALRLPLATTSTTERPTMTGRRKPPVVREEVHDSDDEDTLALQLNFGRWTSPIEKEPM